MFPDLTQLPAMAQGIENSLAEISDRMARIEGELVVANVLAAIKIANSQLPVPNQYELKHVLAFAAMVAGDRLRDGHHHE
jgi:hypothetical protein